MFLVACISILHHYVVILFYRYMNTHKWLAAGWLTKTLRGHEHVVECLSFGRKSNDASTLVSNAAAASSSSIASSSQSANNSNGAVEGVDNSKSITNNEFGYLASGSRDRTVRLWDALLGQCLMVFSVHDSWVRSVILHPSGKYIISCSDDKSIRVLDIKENRCMRAINDAHSHFVTCLAMSKNHTVISGSVDKNVSVWGCN